MMPKIIIFFTLAIIPSLSLADEGAARSGLPQVKIGADSRAAAVGNAGVALDSGASSLYWNPASLALSSINKISSALSYYKSSLDRDGGFVSIVENRVASGFGMSLNYFQLKNLEGRDESGNLTGDFKSQSYEISATYGSAAAESFYWGSSVKYYRVNIAESRASGLGIGLGVLYQPDPFLSLGFSMQDLSSGLYWSTGSKEAIETVFRLGGVYQVIFQQLFCAAEIDKPMYQRFQLHSGLEFRLAECCAIRTGYDNGNFTAGAGFKDGNYQLDYSYCLDRYQLGDCHRFTLSIDFNNAEGQDKDNIENSMPAVTLPQ